ncbi:hypothetical protein NQ315_004156 [Exocentrus adspersus]|uniref:Uncharacterized protein n=1 Tax=Exocentrus adspersus TaxID=1586481 RepID=A0AAV8W6X8_9CUCU|nr:hypothetical protein NQ315_004156 [Exocentrus adspersus]
MFFPKYEYKDITHTLMMRPPPLFEKQFLTLAAFINSSARHSAIVLMLRNAASRAPVQSNHMAWFTLRKGETSTACLLTVPARPIRVESSRGPELIMADTKI